MFKSDDTKSRSQSRKRAKRIKPAVALSMRSASRWLRRGQVSGENCCEMLRFWKMCLILENRVNQSSIFC